MEANCVILDPIINLDLIELAVQDQAIRIAAEGYIQTQHKADELKVTAEDRLMSGTPGTVYLKKMGHRPLAVGDIQMIIGAMGTQDDKQSLSDFSQAQQQLSERLKPIGQFIRLVLEQADIPYMVYYGRLKRPDLWKAEQMIRIVDVLDRLRI